MKFEDHTKSDDLSNLRDIFSEGGLFEQFGHMFQVSLILDANTVIADIRWLLLKAKVAGARTSLQESIDSSVVKAFAPTYLIEEIQTHLPRIIAESGKDEALAMSHWEYYKKNICFIDVGGAAENEIDPKDVPYVKLQELLGHPIVTKDSDIENMGAKAVHIHITAITRDYSRSAAVEYQIKLAGIGSIMLSEALIRCAGSFLKSLSPQLSRVPAWAWLLLIGGCFWLWSIPSFRIWVHQLLENIPEQSKALGKKLISEVSEAFLEYAEYTEVSRLSLNRLEREYGV